MELSTKLYILDDSGKKFMGAGVLWLLENRIICREILCRKTSCQLCKCFTVLIRAEIHEELCNSFLVFTVLIDIEGRT